MCDSECNQTMKSRKIADEDFESVWKLMYDGTVIIYQDSIQRELMCSICKQVMKDAFLSSFCDCRYCYKCIDEYTCNKGKYCPSDKEDCNDQIIELGKNVNRNKNLNRRISSLKASCPNQSCSSINELIEMSDHLRFCIKQPMECPCVLIGCSFTMANKEIIVDHLKADTLEHAQLFIEANENLRNEIYELRDRLDDLSYTSKCGKESPTEEFIKNKNINVASDGELKNEIELVRERENKMKEENEKQKKQIDDMNTKLENAIQEIKSLKLELESTESILGSTILSLTECLSKVKEETDKRDNEREDQKQLFEEARKEREQLKREINKMKKDRKFCDEDRDRRINKWIKWNKLYPNIDADFVYKFPVWSNINKSQDSSPFHSNDCKLCLSMTRRITGTINDIGLFCYIMKGENDDKVPWNIKRVVIISIIDQVTHKGYITHTFNAAFDQPTHEKGKIFGSSSFIAYLSIKDNKSIIVDDSIIVSCVISEL